MIPVDLRRHPEAEPVLLPTPDPTDGSLDEELFHALRTMWAKELRCSEELISLDTNFHELGGNSLALLGMLSKVALVYIDGAPNVFFDETLGTGGHLTIRSLISLIRKISRKR